MNHSRHITGTIPMEEPSKIELHIPLSDKRALQQIATTTGTTVAFIVRGLISEYLRKNEGAVS